MKKRYDVQRFGVPSWKKLVEVVGARMGGANSSIASEIADDHPMKGTKRPHGCESGEGADKKICLDASGIVIDASFSLLEFSVEVLCIIHV